MLDYYASPTGSGDGLSPLTPTSIANAKLLARTGKLSDSVTVWLLGGTYNLTEPLVFTADDSGSVGDPVRWKSFDGDRAVLSGGVSITGWTLHDAGKNIWKTTTPAGLVTRQLYVAGIRADRSYRAIDAEIATADNGLTYVSSVADMPVFANPDELEFTCVPWQWAMSKISVDSVTRVGDVTTFTMNSAAADWNSKPGYTPWQQYPLRLENAYEFLDSTTKGCWYHDAATDTIYYVPRDGENMATVEVVFPVAESLLTVSAVSPVTDVTFDDIVFAFTGWTLPTTQRSACFTSSDNFFLVEAGHLGSTLSHPPASVNINYAQRVTLNRCGFRNLGGSGLEMGEGVINSVISSCEFSDISCSGLYASRTPTALGTPQCNTGNTVWNCLICNVGVEYSGHGALIDNTDYFSFLHNEIAFTPYSGLSFSFSLNRQYPGNEIAYNKVHDVMMVLHDGAAIYNAGAGTVAEPLIVHDNYIYNVQPIDAPIYGADSGLYPDLYSDNIQYYNNVILRTAQTFAPNWYYANFVPDYYYPDPENHPEEYEITYMPNVTAWDNYATAELLRSATDGNTLVNIEGAIEISGSDPYGWGAIPRGIALSSGIIRIAFRIEAVTADLDLSTDIPDIMSTLQVAACTADASLSTNIPSITTVANINSIRAPNGEAIGVFAWSGTQFVPVTITYV